MVNLILMVVDISSCDDGSLFLGHRQECSTSALIAQLVEEPGFRSRTRLLHTARYTGFAWLPRTYRGYCLGLILPGYSSTPMDMQASARYGGASLGLMAHLADRPVELLRKPEPSKRLSDPVSLPRNWPVTRL